MNLLFLMKEREKRRKTEAEAGATAPQKLDPKFVPLKVAACNIDVDRKVGVGRGKHRWETCMKVEDPWPIFQKILCKYLQLFFYFLENVTFSPSFMTLGPDMRDLIRVGEKSDY